VAGTPAREAFVSASASAAAGPSTQPAIHVHVDPSTLPSVSVDFDVTERGDLSQADAQDVALTLAENLEVEAQALRRGEQSLLASVDVGARLAALHKQVEDVIQTGQAVVPHYTFESIQVVLVHTQGQSGLSLGLQSSGTVERVTYGVDGTERSRETSPFARTFVLSRPTGARWLTVDTQPND